MSTSCIPELELHPTGPQARACTPALTRPTAQPQAIHGSKSAVLQSRLPDPVNLVLNRLGSLVSPQLPLLLPLFAPSLLVSFPAPASAI